MARPPVAAMFDAEHAAFHELAHGLTPEQWGLPSLCAGWTVGDVVTHTTFHTHRDGLREILGSPPKVMPRLLEREQAGSPEGLLAWLDRPVPDRARRSWVNVCELVIHQQDVRRVVDAPRDYPEATLRIVLDRCTSGAGTLLVIGRRRPMWRGVRLVADDLAWSKGSGAEAVGTGEALLMAIAGRPTALTELAGPGVAQLASRLWSASAAV